MDFEEIAHYFRDRGFTNINQVANNGIDIIALSSDKKRIGFLCKNGKIHKNDVQKFYSALNEGNITKGFIIFNGNVTGKATKFVKETPIDLLCYSEMQTKPVRKPHWQYRLARDFMALTIIGMYCFLFTVVTFGVMEEAKHTYHAWSVIYFLNGIFGAVFLIYPFNVLRLGFVETLSRWETYLAILFVLICIANIVGSLIGEGSMIN